MNTFIALDVGGTSIKTSVITPNGTLLTPGITHYPSLAKEDKETLLNHFTHIILDKIKEAPYPIHIIGIGMAFPGPFDYEKGIPLMQNINKYDSLYGIYLGKEILLRLRKDKLFNEVASPNCKIKFENDASLYALGETVLNQALMQGKVLCLCIGTGLGSAFLEDGKLITNHPNVPLNGWVYDTPFLDSIIDDYISARGILKLHESLHHVLVNDVKSIYDLALEGCESSLKTFHIFGSRFAQAITCFLQTFQPNTLVLGGQIAKSFPLFKESFLSQLQKVAPDLTVTLSLDSSLSTLVGVTRLFE